MLTEKEILKFLAVDADNALREMGGSSGRSGHLEALVGERRVLLRNMIAWTLLAGTGLGCKGAGELSGLGLGRKEDSDQSGAADDQLRPENKSLKGSGKSGDKIQTDVLAELPQGEAQRRIMCDRGGRDRVRAVFCAGEPPQIRGLKDLQQKLGLSAGNGGGGILGALGGANFAFSGASSSLVAKFTSAVNPRLVMFTRPNGRDPNMTALGFVRGEQFAEIIARDSSSGNLNFFLLHFQQDCNDREGGCNNGELLGPGIESNWREVTVYEDKDIENTILDCKQCHQPGGEGTAKILRMQELRNPWTHFMRSSTGGGRALTADFRRAHPNEEFAGIPANRIAASDPAQLEQLVRQNGFGNQPNEFPSAAIEGGGVLGILGGGGNRNGGRPAVWDRLYDNFVRGQAIAPPFHQVRVTDPNKLNKMTQAYLDLASGRVKNENFPDTRDILLDSGMRDMGFMVKEGLSAEQILVQACSQCHNSKLNQAISRAKFDVNLAKMDREEKDKAIERLRLGLTDVKKMPPERFRVLTEGEIAKLEALLRK